MQTSRRTSSGRTMPLSTDVKTIFPTPIDLTAFSESVDYEFRNADYAAEFASLNNSKTDEEIA